MLLHKKCMGGKGYMMRNAVVTGADGFLGSSLVEELVSHDINVTVITRRDIKIDNCKCIHLDLENIDELPELINEQIDVFYHLAWKGMSGTELYSPDIQLDNCRFLIKCMRAAQKIGCEKFIGAGSISQYENESDGLHITKDKERYYRSCKSLCERYGSELAQELGLSFIWPIITSVYGPSGVNPERLIFNIIKTMLQQKNLDMSEGKQIFDFVYVKDAAKAYWLMGEKGIPGKRYVVGSGEAKSLREWLEPVPGILGSGGKLNFGKRQFNGIYLEQKYYDISQLTKDTGYLPEVKFATGIQIMAEKIKTLFPKVSYEQ